MFPNSPARRGEWLRSQIKKLRKTGIHSNPNIFTVSAQPDIQDQDQNIVNMSGITFFLQVLYPHLPQVVAPPLFSPLAQPQDRCGWKGHRGWWRVLKVSLWTFSNPIFQIPIWLVRSWWIIADFIKIHMFDQDLRMILYDWLPQTFERHFCLSREHPPSWTTALWC